VLVRTTLIGFVCSPTHGSSSSSSSSSNTAPQSTTHKERQTRMSTHDSKLRHRHDELPQVVISPAAALSSLSSTAAGAVTGDQSPQRHVHLLSNNNNSNHLKLNPLSPLSNSAIIKSRDHQFGQQYMFALTIAGMCSSLLSTVFDLLYVDVFLRVYRLPLHAYSIGSVAFSLINTANDLLGAWLLDAAAANMNRSDLIGISGCILSLCFLCVPCDVCG
jgi:hypothetical protein